VGLSDWYVLQKGGKRGGLVAGYKGRCHSAAAVLRGEESVAAPMEFGQHMGGKVYDWIATSHLWFVLLSPRLQSVLRDSSFTGWQTIPAVITRKKQGALEGYGCFVVTGRTGDVRENKSRREWRPPPVAKGRPAIVNIGLCVDFGKWDGSDICIPQQGAYILANARVRDALAKAKITGVDMVRLDEYETEDWDATEKLWKEMGYK